MNDKTVKAVMNMLTQFKYVIDTESFNAIEKELRGLKLE